MKKPLGQKSLPGIVFGAAMVLMASAGCMTKTQSSNPPPTSDKESAAAIQEQERQKETDRLEKELSPPLSGKSNDHGQ